MSVELEKYNLAKEHMENGSYNKAEKILMEISEYQDANVLLEECRKKYQEIKNQAIYDRALALAKKKEYQNAIDEFEKLGDYKQSKEHIAQCQLLKENKKKEKKKKIKLAIIISSAVLLVALLVVIIIGTNVSYKTESIQGGCRISSAKVGFLVRNIEIPEEIDGMPVKEIGGHAFGYNANPINISIPDSVTSIGYGAFD